MYAQLLPQLVTQLLPSLVLPIAITLYYKVFSNNQYNYVPPKSKKTKWDYLVNALLIFGILYETYELTLNRPYDIFKATNVSPDLRSFELRKVFQQVIVPDYIPNEELYLQWWNQPYRATVRDMPPNGPLQEFHFLSHKLRNVEGRIAYSKFGHQNVAKCTFCQEDTDYILFMLPTAFIPYLVAMVIIGLASIHFPKEGWRFWTILIIIGLLSAQCIMYLDFRISEYLKVIGYDLKSFWLDFHQLSHLVLLSLYGCILFIDIPPAYGPTQYFLQSIQQNLIELEELSKLNHYYDLSLKLDKSLLHQLSKEPNLTHPLIEFINDPRNADLVQETVAKGRINEKSQQFYNRLVELIETSRLNENEHVQMNGDKKNE